MFVTSEATILHADVDSFFASVEQREDPSLRGRPVIVGPGVVMAASYEAKARGVRSAMGAAQARRLCPEAVFVSPHFDAYVAASKELFAVFEETAPRVEGMSLEEAFLDVSGLELISGSPRRIAQQLRRRVREDLQLPISVGVARTKVVAKVASAAAKPDGLLVIPAGRELEFLHPLPVDRLWGVGAVTARKLARWNIATIGDIAERPEDELVSLLGPASGRHLHAISRGLDPRRVRAGRRRRSIGSQSALGRRPHSAESLDRVLIAIVERVTGRMRAKGRAGRTIILRLRFGDFSRATRSRTLANPTAATATVLATARSLLRAAMPAIAKRGITLIGLTVANLNGGGAIQLELPLEARSGSRLDAALDEIRERFGSKAVVRAALIGSRR